MTTRDPRVGREPSADVRELVETTAAHLRPHLAEAALDGLVRRLDAITDATEAEAAALIRSTLSRADVEILRLEAASAYGIAEACRQSIAPRIIAYEESARRKNTDLTAAADAIGELLAGAATGARA